MQRTESKPPESSALSTPVPDPTTRRFQTAAAPGPIRPVRAPEGIRNRRASEKDKSDHDKEKGAHALKQDKSFLFLFDMKKGSPLYKQRLHQLAGNDIKPVQQTAADDKRPRAAVPVSDGKPQNQHGEKRRRLLRAFFAEFSFQLLGKIHEKLRPKQRIKQIVFQPVAQADMPSSPVFLDASR